MTVNPRFGHQKFLHTTLAKIQRVRKMINEFNPNVSLRWTAALMLKQRGLLSTQLELTKAIKQPK